MLCLTNQNIKTPKLSKIIRYLTDNLDAVGKVRYEVNNLRDARLYRWLELPQVSFLSRQIFCRNKHVFVETKHVFYSVIMLQDTTLKLILCVYPSFQILLCNYASRYHSETNTLCLSKLPDITL